MCVGAWKCGRYECGGVAIVGVQMERDTHTGQMQPREVWGGVCAGAEMERGMQGEKE